MKKENKLKVSKEDLINLINYQKENNVTIPEAKKDLGLSFTKSLAFYQRRYGLNITLPITKEKVEEIIKYSLDNKIPEKEACKHFNINGKSLYEMKKRLGIKTNPIGNAPFTARGQIQYKINDNFFETPNLLNCYYAGFFAADGCVQENKRVCSIGLSSKDRDWLVKFGKDLCFEGVVHDSVLKEKFLISKLVFNSAKIVEDLNNNFNITPRKSLTLMPPNITEKELIDAFICGYIDGDGCICFANNGEKQKRLVISVIGTLDMVTWIKNRICEIIGKEVGTISHKKGHSEKVFSYSFGDRIARKIFLKYYLIDVPKLKRKWNKEVFKYCNNYHKRLPVSRRKGVNVFDLYGTLIKHFDTLKEAQDFTGVNFTRISDLCKNNSNNFMTNGFMFSRDETMEKYIPPKKWNGWKFEREILIKEGKIKPEDFPL